MDNNEIIKKIAEKLSLDPELLKTVGDLTLSGEDFKIADEQTPDTMYVLTGRVKITTDEELHIPTEDEGSRLRMRHGRHRQQCQLPALHGTYTA